MKLDDFISSPDKFGESSQQSTPSKSLRLNEGVKGSPKLTREELQKVNIN